MTKQHIRKFIHTLHSPFEKIQFVYHITSRFMFVNSWKITINTYHIEKNEYLIKACILHEVGHIKCGHLGLNKDLQKTRNIEFEATLWALERGRELGKKLERGVLELFKEWKDFKILRYKQVYEIALERKIIN